jgi:hypothetical protein
MGGFVFSASQMQARSDRSSLFSLKFCEAFFGRCVSCFFLDHLPPKGRQLEFFSRQFRSGFRLLFSNKKYWARPTRVPLEVLVLEIAVENEKPAFEPVWVGRASEGRSLIEGHLE